MTIRSLPDIEKALLAVSTTEVFFPLTPFYPSLEALIQLSAVLLLTSKSGNFQARLGVQCAATDMDEASAAVNPASATTQVTATGTRLFLRFDPNGATEGNVDANMYFRIGVFVSLSSGSTPATGTVRVQSLCWR